MQIAFVSLLLAALTSQAFAVLFITSPTLGTTAQGGSSLTISWVENGTAPLLADIGPCSVGLYVGNMQQQTELQSVSSSVDVSKQSSLSFTVDPTIGPDSSNAYFIRFNSIALKDPSNPQFNYEAFSSKFALTNMSGTFNSSIQAQINGVTSAVSTNAATPAAAAPPSSTPKISTTTLPAAAQAASSTSGSSSAAKSTQKSSATSTCGNIGVLSAISVIVGLVGLTL